MALHHAAPGEKVRLVPLSDAAHAKTAALVKTDAFEAAQLFLRAGEAIAGHSVPGYAILHCLEGDVTVHATTDIRLGAGDWVFLERGERHSVSALEDSSLLLTILFE